MLILVTALLIISVLIGLWRIFDSTNQVTSTPFGLRLISAAGITALVTAMLSGQLYVILISILSLIPLMPFAIRLFQNFYYEKNPLSEITTPVTNNTKMSDTVMSRAEALLILGLDETATNEAIRKSHMIIIQKVHPDHGGSDYLTQKVNQARDILLNKTTFI